MKSPFTKVTFEINRKLQKEDRGFFSPTQGEKIKGGNLFNATNLLLATHGITTHLELLSVYHIYNVY